MNKFLHNRNTASVMIDGVLTLLGAEANNSLIAELPDTSRPVLDFASALKNKETPIEELLECFRQIRHPGLEITFAMINRLLAKGLTDPAATLLDDIAPDAMPPKHKVIYAEILAFRGEFDDAEKLIDKAYAADDTLKDAHARIAMKIFWPKKEYDKVIEWMEKDLGDRSREPES